MWGWGRGSGCLTIHVLYYGCWDKTQQIRSACCQCMVCSEICAILGSGEDVCKTDFGYLAALALMLRQWFPFISNPRDTCSAALCVSASQPLLLWGRLKRLSRSRRLFLAGWAGVSQHTEIWDPGCIFEVHQQAF